MRSSVLRARNTLTRFFNWWLGELAMLVPPRLRHRFRRRGRTLCVAVEPSRVRVSRRERGRTRDLGEAPMELEGGLTADDRERLRALTAGMSPESTDVEVTVVPELGLVRDVELPAAARDNLHQVLGFEMQRLTPFAVEDVYYRHGVIGRRDEALQVRLAAVPRRIVDRATEWLENWTLRPTPESRARLGPRSPVDGDGAVVLGFRDLRYRTSRRRRLAAALVVLNVLLVGVAVAIPMVQEQRGLDAARIRLEEVRRAADASAAGRREIEESLAMAGFLAAAAENRVATVAVLEELTRRLPDTAWVFKLELRDGSVQLHGSSVEAVSLIALLEDSPTLSNVRFASPVVREGNTGRDRFHVAAKISALGEGG